MSDSDGMQEAGEKISGYMTLAVTVAMRAAEVAAHRRAQQMREAQQRDQEAVRAAEARFRAEVALVKHDLRDVNKAEWWRDASVDQVAGGYAAARAYGRDDVELAGVAWHMAEEIRSRYGVDAEQLVAAAEETSQAYIKRGMTPPRMQLVGAEAEVGQRAEAYVDGIAGRAAEVDVFQETGVMAEVQEQVRREARAQEVDRILTKEYGPDWPGRDDVRGDVSYTAGFEDYGIVSADDVENARRARTVAQERVEAVAVVSEADVVDAVAAASTANDPVAQERRIAERLAGAGVGEEAQSARMAVSVAQPRPVTAAVAQGATGKGPAKARKAASKGAERELGR